MNKLLSVLIAGVFATVAATGFAQDKKADAPKADAPKAEMAKAAPKADAAAMKNVCCSHESVVLVFHRVLPRHTP